MLFEIPKILAKSKCHYDRRGYLQEIYLRKDQKQNFKFSILTSSKKNVFTINWHQYQWYLLTIGTANLAAKTIVFITNWQCQFGINTIGTGAKWHQKQLYLLPIGINTIGTGPVPRHLYLAPEVPIIGTNWPIELVSKTNVFIIYWHQYHWY